MKKLGFLDHKHCKLLSLREWPAKLLVPMFRIMEEGFIQ
jgi:hypothetical protein